jgi:uncharacterized protein (DUF3084 family)
MSMQSPQNLALIAVAAFLLGWLLAWVSTKLNSRRGVAERDPRDENIRALQAELRVAQKDVAQLKSEAEEQQQSLEDTTLNLQAKNSVIAGQQAEIDRLADNLKGSVRKTQELREELADRATQNVYAEAKIREVETELSIAQASADILATGVFDEQEGSEDQAESDKGESDRKTAEG